MSEMMLQKRSDGWWIINVPDSVTECGPYDTKAEADDDRRGLARTFKMLDNGTLGRRQRGDQRL